jgi:GT2 family glycosyltransferase
MSSLDFFVGTRLHSIIMSRLLDIPALSLSYDLKTDEFAGTLKLPSIRIEKLTQNDLLPHLESLVKTDRADLPDLECEYRTPGIFKEFMEGNVLVGGGEERAGDMAGNRNEILAYKSFLKALRMEASQKDREIGDLTAIKDSLDAQLVQTREERDSMEGRLARAHAALNDIYSSDFWKVARLYYRVRDKSPVLKSVYKVAKRLKSFLKRSKYLYYLSRFREYSKEYGLKEALSKSRSKLKDGLHAGSGTGAYRVKPEPAMKESPALNRILHDTADRKGIIIYPSIIDWNFPLFQRPQQLARAFARKGFLVFYCTPNHQYDNYIGFHELSKYLYACKVEPEVFVKAGIQPVVIINWPTDKGFLDSLAGLKKKVLYDHIDHIDVLSTSDENILRDHVRLIKESSVVTVTANDLYEDTKNYRKDVVLCPNGVDLEHFAYFENGYPEEINEVLSQGKPVIGYSGALAKWFDYDLLAYCASERPDYNFLLLGHEHDTSFVESGFEKFDNVFRAGPVNYNILPAYLKAFDVAMIPFKVNSITTATSPIKLFEYAACAKPIVTTALPECMKYKEVLISRSKEEFLENIDRAIKLKSNAEYLDSLLSIACENTWAVRVDTIVDALDASTYKLTRNLHSYDIISFPIMPWFSRFQRSQQLLTKFSSSGTRVFRIDTAFLSGNESYALAEVQNNILQVTLHSSRPLSIFKDSLDAESLNRMMRSIKDLKADNLISNTICVVELPFWYPLARELKERYGWKIVYDCMDDHEGFSTNDSRMLSDEVRLAIEADLLVVTARGLHDKMSIHNDNCVLIPNATDFEHFSSLPENELLKNTRKPIIGYYGAISDWFDNAMVEYAAKSRKGWNFVLIGNTFGADISVLEKLPNVSLLGEIPYSELPKYLNWFDVCLIPFKLNKLTETTNPVKFYEYISSGKPVVATKLPELLALEEYLYLADDKEDFVRKITHALEENSGEEQKKRIELALNNTWEKRYEALNSSILKLYPKVSIIIVTFNNVELTQTSIDSIYSVSQYPNFEIIIIDNNSTDGTREYLTKISDEYENIRIVLNVDNKGFAAANNQAIEMAKGDYIILLNNDTVVTPGWITRLLRYLEDKNIGMVGPVTNMCGNEAKISVPYDMKSMEGFEEYVDEYYRFHPEQDYFEIDMLGMFCVALRRKTIDEIGLLDERFEVGTFEDTDYAHRLKRKGYKIICARDVYIHHYGNASFGKLLDEEYLKIYRENRRRFEEKWGMTSKY